MKVNIEIDCTPEEARTFLGLPDVKAFNQMMMDEMLRRAEANMDQMDPEVLMKQWTAFGGQMTNQFMDLMRTASGGSTGTTKNR
ncbi:DUF6489 family protein [Maricaulis parjimensis]|uniref:DUF6489 family protein n=1 Tax=Maricaulis parjimensis TaxID=144023 RepID=UPI00193A6EEF|nr:DUF6489 family protein [Maricaulis parjimensis]